MLPIHCNEGLFPSYVTMLEELVLVLFPFFSPFFSTAFHFISMHQIQFFFQMFLQKYEDQTSTSHVLIFLGGDFNFPSFLPMQSAVQAVCSAGMELKNIKEFYRQWKEIG